MSEPLILRGKPVAQEILDGVRQETEKLREEKGVVPGLTVVLVGDDPASVTYVSMKERKSRELGFDSRTLRLPEETTQEELLRTIDELNADGSVHGILVQIPLPRQIDEQAIIERIDPAKDVDGLHPINVGKMVIGLPGPLPCTPAGVLEMFRFYDIATSGKRALIIGRSNIVGKPLANMMLQKREGGNAIVTVAHSAASDLRALTREAEILVAAIGRPQYITADMVREGAVVIDVGVNRIEDPSRERGYRVVGDVDYDAVSERASAITPVPGGVGVMTIAMLMQNTLRSARGEFSSGR